VSEPRKVLLDARRLLCPMPVIRVQNAVAELRPGDRLEATCSDPGVLHDIPAWCRINGHKVLESRRDGADYILLVEVGDQ
jgi:tRNA 2-thiouridine synthesizing protein A